MASSVQRPLPSPLSVHRWAWVLAAGFFIVGDVVTTGIGLSLPGVVERNPAVVSLVTDHGFVAMVALKALVVGAAYLVYRVTPRPHAVGIPLGFAVVGVAVTGWNLLVLATAVSV